MNPGDHPANPLIADPVDGELKNPLKKEANDDIKILSAVPAENENHEKNGFLSVKEAEEDQKKVPINRNLPEESKITFHSNSDKSVEPSSPDTKLEKGSQSNEFNDTDSELSTSLIESNRQEFSQSDMNTPKTSSVRFAEESSFADTQLSKSAYSKDDDSPIRKMTTFTLPPSIRNSSTLRFRDRSSFLQQSPSGSREKNNFETLGIKLTKSNGDSLNDDNKSTSVFDFWKESSAPEHNPEIRNSIFLRINDIDASADESTANSYDDSSEEGDYRLLNWASFQKDLKEKYHLVKSEQTVKENYCEDVKKLTTEYFIQHLRSRELIELLKIKLLEERLPKETNMNASIIRGYGPKESSSKEDRTKILISEPYEALGETSFSVRKLFNKIYENPKLAAIALRNAPENNAMHSLEYSLCNQFYHNLLEKGRYEYDLLRLIAESLKLELSGTNSATNFLVADRFSRRMIEKYLNQACFRKYLKVILKNAIQKISQDSAPLLLDSDSISKSMQFLRRSDTLKPLQQCPMSKSFVGGFEEKPKQPVVNNRIIVDHRPIQTATKVTPVARNSNSSKQQPTTDLKYSKLVDSRIRDEKIDWSFENTPNDSSVYFIKEKSKEEFPAPPKFQKIERTRSRGKIKSSQSNLIASDNTKNQGMNLFEELAKSGEMNKILSKNLLRLTSYTDMILRALFDTIYSMPIGIRIICKLTCLLVSQKFELSQREEHRLVARIILGNWIIPLLINPELHEIAEDFSKNRQTSKEVAVLLEFILMQQQFETSHRLSILNSYITSFRSSIQEYFNELLNINTKPLQALVVGENVVKEDTKKVKLTCFCLSVEDIKTLAKQILNNEAEIYQLDQQVVKFAKNILESDSEYPIYSNKLRPDLTFVNFYDLKFPKTTTGSYIEEFLRIHNYSKDMPDFQKLPAKFKHTFKQLLIHLEDLKDISTIAYNDEMTLEDILLFCQEKINVNETKLTKKKRPKSVHLSSRLLLNYMKKLDSAYCANNFQKIFTDMVKECEENFNVLYRRAQKNKVELARGIDSLKRRNELMKEANSKRCRALQRAVIREFLNKVTVPLCIRFPGNPTVQDQIILQSPDKCLVGKLKFINELTYSTASNVVKLVDVKEPEKYDAKSACLPKSTGNDQHFHCSSLSEVVDAFASLPIVREAVMYRNAQAIDPYSKRVSDTYCKILQLLFDAASNQMAKLKEEDKKIAMEEIENYVGKKLSIIILPRNDRGDEAFWMRCKTFEWIDFHHLEIPEANRCPEIWDYVASKLAEIDYKLTPISKSVAVLEAFNIISYIINQTTLKNDFGADELTPIIIYIMVRWCPKRIFSNLNFISRFRYDYDRISKEAQGYYTESLRSAVYYLENLTSKQISINAFEFEMLVHQRELKYDFYFLRTRPRREREILNFTSFRQKRKQREIVNSGRNSQIGQ